MFKFLRWQYLYFRADDHNSESVVFTDEDEGKFSGEEELTNVEWMNAVFG